MPLNVPNATSTSIIHQNQSMIDNVDFDIAVMGFESKGVASGCVVTPGATAMRLTISAGELLWLGKVVTVNVSTDTLTLGAAHATNPRFDLVVVNSSGTISIVAGTAAALPIFPDTDLWPANSVCIAAVYVPALATSITANNIVDKRIVVRAELQNVVKVESFASDGRTITAAVAQAALDSLGGTGTAIFPPGTHAFGNNIVTVNGSIRILGWGPGETIITYGGSGSASTAFHFNSNGTTTENGYLGHMTINGNTGTVGAHGITLGQLTTNPREAGLLIENVLFTGNRISGAWVQKGRFVTFLKCRFSSNKAQGGDGCRVESSNVAQYSDQINFVGCMFINNVRGFYANSGEMINLSGCIFKDNGEEGSFLQASATASNVLRSFTFENCTWSNNNDARVGSGFGQHRQEMLGGPDIEDVELRLPRFTDLIAVSTNFHILAGNATGPLSSGMLRVWEPSINSTPRIKISNHASNKIWIWDNTDPSNLVVDGVSAAVTFMWMDANGLRIYVNSATGMGKLLTLEQGRLLGFYAQGAVVRQAVTGHVLNNTSLVLDRLLAALHAVGIIDDQTTGTGV